MASKLIQDYITKQHYMSFSRCPKASWLQKNVPLLQADPYYDHLSMDMPEIRKAARELFRQGNPLIISKSNTIQTRIHQTKKAIENPDVQLIMNPTFVFNGFLLECEVLRRSGKKWDLIDFKAALSIKRHHYKDLAYQKAILAKKDIVLDQIYLYLINRYYVRSDELNPNTLFIKKKVTSQVYPKTHIYQEFKQLKNVMAQSAPERELGVHCIKPVECRFKSYCWEKEPPDSVYRLRQLNPDQLAILKHYNLHSIRNLPDSMKLNTNQKIQVRAQLTGKPHLDIDKLKAFVGKLKYPLYFLDFECVQYAIPQHKGEKPFNQTPFQFSLHIRRSPRGLTEHIAWISDPKDPSTHALAKALVEHINTSGSVIVFAKQLEEFVLTKLAKDNPIYKKALLTIKHQIVDLSVPFLNKWLYVSEMGGSHSIKAIVSALSPEDNYDHLVIKNGDMASKAYVKLTNETDEGVIAQTIQYLKDYCEMDTLAMVKIVDAILARVETAS